MIPLTTARGSSANRLFRELKNPRNEFSLKIASEYDQEIPQSQPQTTPWHRQEEPLNHHETPGRQIKQSNQLSLPQ